MTLIDFLRKSSGLFHGIGYFPNESYNDQLCFGLRTSNPIVELRCLCADERETIDSSGIRDMYKNL